MQLWIRYIIQGGPKRVSHYLIIIKSYYEIRFIRQIKVSIKYYNIICWH